ncbi:MAG: helix-turn-helix domain-containing protein [Chloroflexi bacterium]|nr:helix-turn-helix domain-containing protein [Chloroflexota bacterium]
MAHEKIRQLRFRLGLSQERFARLLGVSLQSVRRWEAGISRPLPIIELRLEELARQVGKTSTGGATMTGRQSKPGAGIEIELGLGDLFKGLGGLFDLVSRVAEEGAAEETRSGVKDVLGGKGKAVYGFSVRAGLGGRPVIESFGNVRTTEAGSVVEEVREPLVDLFDEGDTLRVVAEIPGVEEKDIRADVRGDILTLAAEARDRKYYKEVLLPSLVEGKDLKQSYRSGILELTLKKRTK